MIKESEFKIAGLLCSKLCHDLISPVGAINNGLEFLKESNSDDFDDGHQIIADSAKLAAVRLGYYRLAFGRVRDNELMKFNIVKDQIEALSREKSLEIAWVGIENHAESMVFEGVGKLLMNYVLLISEFVPRGGRAEINLTHTTPDPNFIIKLESDKLIIKDDVLKDLQNGMKIQEVTVRNIVFFYCMTLADISCKVPFFENRLPSTIILGVT